CERHVFADGQLDAPAQRRLDGGLIDFPVALRSVTVADLEERTWREHGDEQRRARHELLVVQVARVASRRIAADASGSRRRRNTEAAEKRTKRDDDARRELGRPVL